MSHCIKPSDTEASLQKSQQPGNPIGPPGLIDKIAKDKSSKFGEYLSVQL
jgi:hypothetical protein